MSGFSLLYSPMVYMEDMFAASATFQSITGSANAAAAKSRIRMFSFIEEHSEEEDLIATEKVAYPRVSLFPFGFSAKKSSNSTYSGNPRLLCEIEISIPSDVKKTHDAEFRYCGPKFQDIVNEVLAQGGQPGFLDIADIDILQPPMPLDPTKSPIDENNEKMRIWICDLIFTARG